MRNRNVTSLLTLGAVAVFLLGMAPAAEAELICKKIRPSGPKVCFEAETGSVDCLTIAQGVAAKLAKDCEGLPDDEDCHIVISCSIYGTIPPGGYFPDYELCGVDENGDFDGFPQGEYACEVTGEGFCTNPGINDYYNENGTSFNLPGPLTAFSSSATCESGGICTETVTVTAQDSSSVCPNANWGLEFTPREFFGQLGFCPGGYSEEWMTYIGGQEGPVCCASDKRKIVNGKEVCFKTYQAGEPTVGEPGFIRTLCEYPDGGPIQKNVKYNCEEI